MGSGRNPSSRSIFTQPTPRKRNEEGVQKFLDFGVGGRSGENVGDGGFVSDGLLGESPLGRASHQMEGETSEQQTSTQKTTSGIFFDFRHLRDSKREISKIVMVPFFSVTNTSQNPPGSPERMAFISPTKKRKRNREREEGEGEGEGEGEREGKGEREREWERESAGEGEEREGEEGF